VVGVGGHRAAVLEEAGVGMVEAADFGTGGGGEAVVEHCVGWGRGGAGGDRRGG